MPRKKSHLFAIGLILVTALIAVTHLHAENHASKYTGEKLSKKLADYAGITIDIQPTKAHYSLAEDITMHCRVQMSPPRFPPWARWQFANHIQLSCDNGEPLAFIPTEFPVKSSGEAVSVYEIAFNLESYKQVKAFKDYGIELLLPGKYTGYFDDGITSNEFEFTIDPLPDSLLSDWSAYCRIDNFLDRRSETYSSAMEDSVRNYSQFFLQLPANSIWRKEALQKALLLFRYFRYDWQVGDSLFCENMLLGLASETKMNAGDLASTALNSLYIKLDRQVAFQQILSLARRSGRLDFIRVAEERVADSKSK
jgi:hypothetical protein